MNLENLTLDIGNKNVSWIYKKITISKTIENIYFANINEKRRFVYVEAGKNFSQEQIYNFSYDGGVIFTLDKLIGKIRWFYNGKEIVVNDKDIHEAQRYIDLDRVLMISKLNGNNKILKCYDLNGQLVFEKEAPDGYTFMHLSTIDNKPVVICDGGVNNIDKYERSSWNFSVDTENGNITKQNLSY